jgi:hypothetical protein
MFARRAAATLGIAAVALTGAMVGDAAAATSGQALPDQQGTAVLVKRVDTARGTLEIFEAAAPQGVTPHSSTGCAGSDPRVCLHIEGSGLYVSYMENDTYVGRSGGIDMQINGPSGIMADSGWFNATAGYHYLYYWQPRGYVAGGYYCATTYAGGGHEGACNTVHN